MAIYKCKMCSGELDVQEGVSVVECDFCGTKQTVPTAKDENLQALFNRANVLRTKNEFDKAEKLYEKILQADEAQAEAYWGLILCKYGIEYVEDPKTFTRIPTCHRTSFDSIIADDDYKSALQYADGVQRGIYEAEAKEIDRLQKEILALSQKEEPYDVFICYKETDETGRRTQDSAIANDIYYQLTNQGFKVFYAAISLEDKLGSAYEPCIFAALNSAKVMLAVGTKPEFFSAVWVKNEWSRFLKMMKNDRSKMLIPCYKDMDAYELPEEFAHLQAQDMGKIGFVNDIVRGISKVISKDTKSTAASVSVENVNPAVAPLLERVFLFLEDGDWESANDYCEKVLDQDPKNATAYLGKLMADLHVNVRTNLSNEEEPFDSNPNYNKLIRFASDDLKTEIEGYIKTITSRIAEAELASEYNSAKSAMKNAKNKQQFLNAAESFKKINDYKDSKELFDTCIQKANNLEKDLIYVQAKNLIDTATTESEIDHAIELLTSISGYLDSADLIADTKPKWLVLFNKFNQLASSFRSIAEASELVNKEENCKSEINKINAEKMRLESFVAVLPSLLQELQNTELQINSKKEKIYSLQQQRNSLGIFAGKQKKEIDANIEVLQSEIKTLTENVSTIQGKTKGYTSVDVLNVEISKLDGKLSTLETELNNIQSTTISTMTVEEIVDGILVEELSVFVFKDMALLCDLLNTPCAIDAIISNPKLLSKLYTINLPQNIIEKLANSKDSRLVDFNTKYKTKKYKNCISAGNWHSMGVKTNGTVVAIGDNDYGQCDDVKKWGDIVSVSAGEWYGLGLKKDGTVITCGDAEDTKIIVNDWQNIVSIATGEKHAVGLKSDGTVAICGDDEKFICTKWNNIAAISAGNSHTVGLKKDGTVIAVGENDDGQCDVEQWHDIVAICTGNGHTVGLMKDGTVVATGDNSDGRCDVEDWSNIVAISAGPCHTVGLMKDGTVVAVGDNDEGQCDVEDWVNITAIAAGSSHTVGLKKNGSVVAVGDNDNCQLDVDHWTEIVSIAADDYTFGVKKDGSVVIAQDDDTYEIESEMQNWEDIVSVSTTSSFAVGLKKDGTVAVAGYENSGDPNQSVAAEWTDIVFITTAENHTLGVKSDGTVVVAGDAGKFDVDSWTNIVEIDANIHNTVGLKSNGTVVSVGTNGNGQNNTASWSDIISVASGGYHTVGLKADGSVVAVGNNEDSQCEVEDWNDIIAIAAGVKHTVGLKSDGTVLAVGPTHDNRCSVSSWRDIVAISAGDDYTMGLTSKGQVVVASDKDYDKHNCDGWKLF